MSSCVWPCHPKPLPDELFSSWIFRASLLNAQKLATLLTLAGSTYRNVTKSMDMSVPIADVYKIAKKLDVSPEAAKATHLKSYEGYAFERTSSKSNHAICILQTGETRHDLNYQQFCPSCLREGTPYFRKHWRLTFITVCTKHECRLLDACPHCHKPPAFIRNSVKHRHMAFNGELTDCFHCGLDISETESLPANKALVDETRSYLKTLSDGYYRLEPGRWIYSFSLFAVLRQLMRVTFGSSKSEYTSCAKKNPDCIAISDRYSVLMKLEGVFRNWPHQLVKYCEEHGITSFKLGTIKKTCGQVPYWLEEVAKESLFFPKLAPTPVSINAAIKHLGNSNKRLSSQGLNKLMGYVDSKVVSGALDKHRGIKFSVKNKSK